ncbi:OmpP1/FadL family transporter [Aquimarina sediminis]|uniref:OmpP1/FadL family transporter n=1 Tax=Aquimarina sediminis TaxID=2070536 RepID=UPI000CA07B75|nr:outer membrane protein transport protein [Aquimarina sediminis]
MKKLFLLIGVLSVSFLNAQDITDALRYSQQEILGTARYRGMSGAFGALGGDLSSLQINPAGSAVFLNSHGSVTLSSRQIDNDVNYFDGFSNRDYRSLNFNQVGVVFIYDNFDPNTSGINKFSLGLTYDQTTDNANKLFAFGRSSNSISNFFLNETQGLPLDLITRRTGENIDELYSFLGENEGYSAQQAFLGHEAFVIEANDPDNPNNTSYSSNIAPGVFDQEYYIRNTGINGKLTINGGMQINQNFYVGGNLNTHFINFDKFTEFFEGNNNPGSNVNEVLFTNRLSTIGAGFSAQIGGIAKVSEILRLGASFESPTWFLIEEETTQRLETFSDTDGRSIVDPNILNLFPEYRLRTPAKATGSIAIIFSQQGLISLDYSYKDYSTIKLSSDEGVDFSNVNRDIDENLQGSSTIRIGTEWRYDNWSIRGGYSFEESPYKNELILGDKTGFSIGTGWTFGKFKFDVAYDYTEQQRIEQFYPNSGFTNAALVDNYIENLTFTLGMNF